MLGTVIAIVTSAVAGPSFAVLPAAVQADPKLPTMIERESKAYMSDVIARRIVWDLEKRNLTVMGPNMITAALERGKIEREKGDDLFSIPYFVKIADYVKADYYIGVAIDRMTQQNRSEAAAAMGKGSDTLVEARLWVFEPKARRMVVLPDRNPLRGTHQGPYFGVARSRDLYGTPDDKRTAIENEQKKRAGAYAEAAWTAIAPKLLPYLNEKPRE